MANDERKWYQKPLWLFGLGILALGSTSNSTSVGRLLIFIFITTGILFLLWFYSAMKTKHKFFAFIISTIITMILFIVLVLLLNWIKCGDYGGSIFNGKCSRVKNTTSPASKSMVSPSGTYAIDQLGR